MKRLRVEIEIPIANDFMNDHVLSFSTDSEIEAAVQKLIHKGYSGAPVVDENGKLVGVLSEVDCLRVLSQAAYEGWPQGTVGEHMTKEVEDITPSTDLFAISGKFTNGKHRRFPVVDANHRLLGLVTRRDLLGALDQFRRKQEHARLQNTYELIEHNRGGG